MVQNTKTPQKRSLKRNRDQEIINMRRQRKELSRFKMRYFVLIMLQGQFPFRKLHDPLLQRHTPKSGLIQMLRTDQTCSETDCHFTAFD